MESSGSRSRRTFFGGTTFWVVARQLGVTTSKLISPMLSSLAVASLMRVLVYGAKIGWIAMSDGYGVVRLVALVGLGMVVYLMFIRHLFRDVSRDFANLLQRLLGPRAVYFNRVLNVGA